MCKMELYEMEYSIINHILLTQEYYKQHYNLHDRLNPNVNTVANLKIIVTLSLEKKYYIEVQLPAAKIFLF